MRRWEASRILLALGVITLISVACVAEPKIFEPRPLDAMDEVAASASTEALDAEVTAFLRGEYAIRSGRYYRAPGEIPWIAISKYVKNQMAEKSVQQTMFEWYEPGLDFIEIYPQGSQGAGFALAMPKGSDPSGEKLVGFYALGAP